MNVGIDIIEVARIKEAVHAHDEPFLNKLFTQKEREYFARYTTPYATIAGHFAAKEALAKALGVGIGSSLSWKQMEISHTKEGKPFVTFTNEISERFTFKSVEISISHCKEYATAIALIT